MIDSHCHLDNSKLEKSITEIVKEGKENGMLAFVNTGYDLESSRLGVDLANTYQEVYQTVGVHPHDAKGVPADYLEQLVSLSKSPKVVSIGEIGLDYYYDFSPREQQKKVFVEQIELANSLKLPYVIHQRDAMGDTLEILNKFSKPQYGAVFHCYSGSLETAKELIRKGFMISIGGPVTFKNAKKTVEVVKGISLEHLLVETDCPYLTPEPYRGKVNYPHFVKHVIEKIALLKNIPPQVVAEKTSQNSIDFFGLGLKL